MGVHRGLSGALRHGGFTLAEVLVTMGLLSVVTSGSLVLLMMSVEFERQAWSQTRCKNEAYTAVERITRDIREAVLVSIKGDNNGVLELRRRDGTTVQYVFTGAGATSGLGDFVFVPDPERPDETRLVARGISTIAESPVFSRDQNVIYLTFRVGDAHNLEQMDLDGATNVQGTEVRTVAVLRKGS